MKNLKPYLLFIFLLVLCTSASAQLINGRFYRTLQGPSAYEYGRFLTELVPPYQLSSSADTGSIAFFKNKWYGKDTSGNWVEFGGITELPSGSIHIETSGYYLVTDSINTIICQYSGGETGIDLPDPSAHNKREITISNVSGNDASFNYLLKYSASEFSATLANGKWVTIKSDGSWWNVVQDSGATTVTGGGGNAVEGEIF